MKVLVTGASGFIGQHTCALLRKLGHTALKFDRQAIDADTIVGDVRDASAISDAIHASDGVIHLAGVLGTSEAVADPWPAVESNIDGSLNVFEACRQHAKRCVYTTVGNYWMLNPYSITKSTAERLARMFNNEHNTEIALVRAFNVFGPGQKHAPVRKIIPSFILSALRNEPLTIFGDGTQVVDMVYVEDVADVLLRALVVDHGRYRRRARRHGVGPMFEACTGRAATVNGVADAVINAVGQGSTCHVPMRPGEPDHSVVLGDPTTLCPLYDGAVPWMRGLEEALPQTIGYYRDQLRRTDADGVLTFAGDAEPQEGARLVGSRTKV